MSNFDTYFNGSLNPKRIFEVLGFKYKFRKEHHFYFSPEGITVFCGSQGSGKTLSAVQLTQKMCEDYPEAILVTNTEIKNISNKTILCESAEKMVQKLVNVSNGEKGVVYFVDEIQTLLNSLQSKDIPIEVITELSQQRRQRKIIIGTSQVYTRMAKPLREQIKNIVVCKKFLGFLQFNRLIDGESTVEVDGHLKYDTEKVFFWFHDIKLYNSYETFGKIKSFIESKKNNNFYTRGGKE